MRRLLLLAATLIVSCNVASAQSVQPYAGLEHRPIKALSQQQIDDLRVGRGMGLALAAELNGYPGPSHVLEFGDRLDLTADQRIRVQRLFDAMKQEAVPLGNKLVEQETELDRLFSARVVTSESLKAALVAIRKPRHCSAKATSNTIYRQPPCSIRAKCSDTRSCAVTNALMTPNNTSTVTKGDHRNADSTMRPRISAVSEYLSV
ncbi:hypothetical protein [Bradyrhizobium lupini]|uniref:hypothetical protein n=1 Tax=Rhizobium lupini TaxID=136996 RepID=UPI0034C64112